MIFLGDDPRCRLEQSYMICIYSVYIYIYVDMHKINLRETMNSASCGHDNSIVEDRYIILNNFGYH